MRPIRSIFAALAVLLVTTPILAQTCVPAPYGIISWYPGEGNAYDIIGNNNGIMGSGTFGPGKVHQAFWFQGGQNDGVDLGDVPAFDFTATSSFSIEAWVNLSTLKFQPGNDGWVIVSLNYRCTLPTPATEMLAIQAGTGKAFFMVRDAHPNPNTVQVTVLSPAQVPTHTWIHLVGVRDASCSPKRVQLYMNGALVASAIDPTTLSLANTGPDYIGRRFSCNTNDPFNGGIDEVSIYNRALTACEIAALYNASCAGKCSPGTCTPTGCGC